MKAPWRMAEGGGRNVAAPLASRQKRRSRRICHHVSELDRTLVLFQPLALALALASGLLWASKSEQSGSSGFEWQ
jgi:hypothetical protein